MLSSVVVKCSKLTKVAPVYRGTAKGVLPETFWKNNGDGVRGGVEAGFMSTTTNREVALGYAKGGEGSTPMLFEMHGRHG